MKITNQKGNVKKKIFKDFYDNVVKLWKNINYDEFKYEKRQLNKAKIELNDLLLIKEDIALSLHTNTNSILMKQNQEIIKKYEKSIIQSLKFIYNKEEIIKEINNKLDRINKEKEKLLKSTEYNNKDLKILLEKYEEDKKKLNQELNIYAENINYYKKLNDKQMNEIDNKIIIKEETIKELKEIINKKHLTFSIFSKINSFFII